ncbi:hypothetical protein Rleg2_4239 [Rhizobium leguminosarum bv. trifolii WSM2304]|uniref:Uncharacterized protein n=1 Tax=Rhizobium leguminosarum bv. trifolii (strain WSM2304) TaxID=395492 RepID=A0ABF7QTT8_RHILW|nr:hypothetical protein [Rhizobium leguminosarum]ACI57500.1 hypothetical protein Rleg2_4239 [Rhizobium leguminosarum bv. trifolii WSM2304]
MSNVIAFPSLLGASTAPTVSEEISQLLGALAARPPSANDAPFVALVAERQNIIDTANTDDDRFSAYLRMGILLGVGIVALQPCSSPA